MIEDRRAILAPRVAELRVGRERIDIVPEGIEQFFVADSFRIVGNLNRFGVAGGARADFLVGRVLFGAAGVAGGGRNDALDLVEETFHGPETAAGKSGLGGLRPLAIPISRVGYHS